MIPWLRDRAVVGQFEIQGDVRAAEESRRLVRQSARCLDGYLARSLTEARSWWVAHKRMKNFGSVLLELLRQVHSLSPQTDDCLATRQRSPAGAHDTASAGRVQRMLDRTMSTPAIVKARPFAFLALF